MARSPSVPLTWSTPPSTLYGLVRDDPRIVPPLGRVPRIALDRELGRLALDDAPPPVAEAEQLVAVDDLALPHGRPQHGVQTRAVAPAREHADAHS